MDFVICLSFSIASCMSPFVNGRHFLVKIWNKQNKSSSSSGTNITAIRPLQSYSCYLPMVEVVSCCFQEGYKVEFMLPAWWTIDYLDHLRIQWIIKWHTWGCSSNRTHCLGLCDIDYSVLLQTRMKMQLTTTSTSCFYFLLDIFMLSILDNCNKTCFI